MSASKDFDNKEIILTGEPDGFQTGLLDIGAAPTNTTRLRIAFRAWWDTFGSTLASGFSTLTTNTGYYGHNYSSTVWDHCLAFGMGFSNVFPVLDRTDPNGLDLLRTFFGHITGLGVGPSLDSSAICVVRPDLFSQGINQFVRSYYNYNTYGQSSPNWLLDQATTGDAAKLVNNDFTATYIGSEADIIANPSKSLGLFPANPTQGAKTTIGWEFIGNAAPDNRVFFRQYMNFDSLDADALMGVFDASDLTYGPLHVNLSDNGTFDATDLWRNGTGVSDNVPAFPRYLMFKHGFVSQTLKIKPVQVAWAAFGTI